MLCSSGACSKSVCDIYGLTACNTVAADDCFVYCTGASIGNVCTKVYGSALAPNAGRVAAGGYVKANTQFKAVGGTLFDFYNKMVLTVVMNS